MIYLDHAASTPVVEEALTAMHRAARERWGNPGSVHAAGRRARAALDEARIEVADYLGCSAAELRWTSGGTDALRRALEHLLGRVEGPVVSSRLEHPALRRAVEAAEAAGREVRWLPMPAGEVDPAGAARALEGASVVALSALHHELGTAAPLASLMDQAPRAFWVVDAVQAAAWLDLGGLFRPRVFVACASQKLGGPAGAGALRIPAELAYPPPGAREGEFDSAPSGTPPWLAAIGMGAACRARKSRRDDGLTRCRTLGERLVRAIQATFPEAVHNAGASWLGPIVNVSLPGIDGRALETGMDLRGVCIARTSACLQRAVAASPAVAAAFPDEAWRAEGATRWSVGIDTTEAEIDEAARLLAEAVDSARSNLEPAIASPERSGSTAP
ncbi:aminotransferase class V-fold PLP-dependent enzyme [Sorangium sp. So ce1036]|uniref:cysteine desulfurase family protein n=1 Tax=Sorangium sp. So ce1036 TaxID=3133328 RepID=UPI003F0FAFF6